MPSGRYMDFPPRFQQAPPAFQQGSSADPWFLGRNTISPKLRECLIEELNINPLYTDHSKQGLQFAWGRYLECQKAIDQAKEMSESGIWPNDMPSYTEFLIVDIFISKTTWYTNYVKTFEPIQINDLYSDMKVWLDDENPSHDDTEDVWGMYSSTYSMEDV
jgi:hypothetical protein